jgi:hypothetical protein
MVRTVIDSLLEVDPLSLDGMVAQLGARMRLEENP